MGNPKDESEPNVESDLLVIFDPEKIEKLSLA
jgi:hypothetical protein